MQFFASSDESLCIATSCKSHAHCGVTARTCRAHRHTNGTRRTATSSFRHTAYRETNPPLERRRTQRASGLLHARRRRVAQSTYCSEPSAILRSWRRVSSNFFENEFSASRRRIARHYKMCLALVVDKTRSAERASPTRCVSCHAMRTIAESSRKQGVVYSLASVIKWAVHRGRLQRFLPCTPRVCSTHRSISSWVHRRHHSTGCASPPSKAAKPKIRNA